VGELLRADAAHRPLIRARARPGISKGGVSLPLGILEPFDERLRLLARELAGRLALGEAQGTARVAEIRVTGVMEEFQQLLDLLR
jgi:hypothetical protein